jgi:hypothetical protein
LTSPPDPISSFNRRPRQTNSNTNRDGTRLIEAAFYFAQKQIVLTLTNPPDRRIGGAEPEYTLALSAGILADAVETYPAATEELWSEPVQEFANRLRTFSKRAFEKAENLKSALDFIPPPNPRGRGRKLENAYRLAFGRTLIEIGEALSHQGAGSVSKEQQDTLVAAFTNVVFRLPDEEQLDPETIRRHRQRQQAKRKRGDNSE